MKQQIIRKRQHLSLENQVQRYPEKTVSKSLQQNTYTTSSWNDLRGLSWIFAEDKEGNLS